MSTRSCIAKPEGDGWKGRYHHSDGYPSGLGRFLFEAHNGFFGGDTDAMVKYLVDDEPVGWSFIMDTDLSKGPAWTEYEDYPLVPADQASYPGQKDYSALAPQSYTARGEEFTGDGSWIRSTDGYDIMIEWIYVLTPGGLMVIDADYSTSSHVFRDLVRWDDPDGVAKIEACEVSEEVDA